MNWQDKEILKYAKGATEQDLPLIHDFIHQSFIWGSATRQELVREIRTAWDAAKWAKQNSKKWNAMLNI